MGEELEKKVNLYLERTEKDNLVENHPLEEEGHWKIIGGVVGDYGARKPIKDILYGTFREAIEYAVQQPNFYADWCAHDNPDNCNHGRVESIDVINL